MIVALGCGPEELKKLEKIIPEASNGEKIIGILDPEEIMDCTRSSRCSVVFLDLDSGSAVLKAARSLRKANPRVNIIFIAGSAQYGGEAMAIHASGYILKPVTADKIKEELCDLRYPLPEESVFLKPFFIRAFGSFEVYGNGVPLRFHYTKTKELFAYLVDRRGASCSNRELMAAMWEDDSETSHISYLKNLKQDLRCGLRILGHEDLLVCTKGGLAVAVRPGLCDYFDYINHVPGAPDYRGEYMSQYSWAEMTHAALEADMEKTE